MDFIEVNGTALRYDLSGSGASTLVLIHEMGGTLESWDLVLPMLAAKRRVLRYDTRGAGLSQKLRGALSIDTMVDDLTALMDALGITGKVALAGIAVGGAIALHAAVRVPAARRGRRSSAARPSASSADRRPAVLARVEKMEREGLHAVIDTLDNGYPPELRGDAQALRGVSRPLARQRSGELRRHLPHARRHGPGAGACRASPARRW